MTRRTGAGRAQASNSPGWGPCCHSLRTSGPKASTLSRHDTCCCDRWVPDRAVTLVAAQLSGGSLLVGADDVVALVLMGVVILPVALALMTQASRHLSAPEIGLLALLETVLGPLWVWMVLGEQPRPAIILAGGAIRSSSSPFGSDTSVGGEPARAVDDATREGTWPTMRPGRQGRDLACRADSLLRDFAHLTGPKIELRQASLKLRGPTAEVLSAEIATIQAAFEAPPEIVSPKRSLRSTRSRRSRSAGSRGRRRRPCPSRGSPRRCPDRPARHDRPAGRARDDLIRPRPPNLARGRHASGGVPLRDAGGTERHGGRRTDAG